MGGGSFACFVLSPPGIYNSEVGCLISSADTTHRQALGKKQNKVGASGRVELPFTLISRTLRYIAYDALYIVA